VGGRERGGREGERGGKGGGKKGRKGGGEGGRDVGRGGGAEYRILKVLFAQEIIIHSKLLCLYRKLLFI
jgi:hypothetical protein